MKTETVSNKNFHLLLGAAAAGLALVLPRGCKWRLPLATVAALEIRQGLKNARLSFAPVENEVAAAPESYRRATIAGVEMRWEEHGTGSRPSVPVVMVHGIPTNPRLWRYVIPKVERVGVRCLAWELVGFGWSMDAGLGRDISVANQAKYLHRWLQHHRITKAVFVGHDLGGGVLQNLLTEHPDLCQGLILVDCVAYENWPVIAVRLARSINGFIEKLPPALAFPFWLAGILNLGHDNVVRLIQSFQLHWKPYARAVGPKAFANQLRNLNVKDTLAVSDRLSRISTPARVVWGEADPLGLASGQKLATALGAPLIRIPGGRHFTPEDRPETIAAAVHAVLEEVMDAKLQAE